MFLAVKHAAYPQTFAEVTSRHASGPHPVSFLCTVYAGSDGWDVMLQVSAQLIRPFGNC